MPEDREAMVKLYTLSRADLDLVLARRSDANRLGFAVQLALLRHPGLAPTEIETPKHLPMGTSGKNWGWTARTELTGVPHGGVTGRCLSFVHP